MGVIEEDSELRFHCDMKDVCESCVLSSTPFQCCYYEFLLTHRECKFGKCFFTKCCPHANLKSFRDKEKRLVDILGNLNNVFKSPATSLPSTFVPEVMPMQKERERAISIIKDIDVPSIVVSLQNFFRGTRETSLLAEARKRGLHEFLNYAGEIVLTTDVDDRLCDKFVENPDYLVSAVKKLKPEYLTTFDTYTYSNVPACIARLKMREVMSSMDKLLYLDCKIIGLALGATPAQIYGYVQTLIAMGCHIIAHPVYELRKGKNPETHSIRWRIRLSKELKAKVLLLSCSPGITGRMRVYADYYSSWSWYSSVNSKDKKAYEKRKAKLSRMIELGKKYSGQTIL